MHLAQSIVRAYSHLRDLQPVPQEDASLFPIRHDVSDVFHEQLVQHSHTSRRRFALVLRLTDALWSSRLCSRCVAGVPLFRTFGLTDDQFLHYFRYSMHLDRWLACTVHPPWMWCNHRSYSFDCEHSLMLFRHSQRQCYCCLTNVLLVDVKCQMYSEYLERYLLYRFPVKYRPTSPIVKWTFWDEFRAGFKDLIRKKILR